jgi:hypothetical protein
MLGLALWLMLVATTSARPAAPRDFAHTVQPILERKCQPCHFRGGVMHAKLPFDRQETVLVLREKLFTRIRDEKERTVIREFLAEHKSRSHS